MSREQRAKKKITNSFYTDEESVNYSRSRNQPNKTIVMDEKNFIQQPNNSKKNTRYKMPNYYEQSSTPRNVIRFHKKIPQKVSFKPNSSFLESFQDLDTTLNEESDKDIEPRSSNLLNDLIKMQNKLTKIEKEYEILQQNFTEIKFLTKNHFHDLSSGNIDSEEKESNQASQNLISVNSKLTKIEPFFFNNIWDNYLKNHFVSSISSLFGCISYVKIQEENKSSNGEKKK